MDIFAEYVRHFEPIEEHKSARKTLTGAAFPELEMPRDKEFDKIHILRYAHAWVKVLFWLDTEIVYTASFDAIASYAGWPLWSNLPHWLKKHDWLFTTIPDGYMFHANPISDTVGIGLLSRNAYHNGRLFHLNEPIQLYENI